MRLMKSTLCIIVVLLNFNIGFPQNSTGDVFNSKRNVENIKYTKQIDQILSLANDNVGFSGTLLVADSSGVIYQNSIGYANVEKSVKLTPEHQISPGSVGKEFTTIAIMMLQEQGKLNYNDKLSKHLTKSTFLFCRYNH